jgi:hypothetical protein
MRAGMTIDIGELHLAQADGGLPTLEAHGSAPGESGVSIVNVRFQDGAHFSATPRQHIIWFQTSPPPCGLIAALPAERFSTRHGPIS